jgi:hypothetical protein
VDGQRRELTFRHGYDRAKTSHTESAGSAAGDSTPRVRAAREARRAVRNTQQLRTSAEPTAGVGRARSVRTHFSGHPGPASDILSRPPRSATSTSNNVSPDMSRGEQIRPQTTSPNLTENAHTTGILPANRVICNQAVSGSSPEAGSGKSPQARYFSMGECSARTPMCRQWSLSGSVATRDRQRGDGQRLTRPPATGAARAPAPRRRPRPTSAHLVPTPGGASTPHRR